MTQIFLFMQIVMTGIWLKWQESYVLTLVIISELVMISERFLIQVSFSPKSDYRNRFRTYRNLMLLRNSNLKPLSRTKTFS